MIEHDNDFHTGFEFLEAAMPLKMLKEVSEAKTKTFKTICRTVGRSLRRDEEAFNILRRNRKARTYELIYLGWMVGRWTKENPPKRGEIA